MEVWLNLSNVYGLEGYDNFEMCEAGVLRNIKTNRIIKGALTKGYIQFCLTKDCSEKKVYKHRILAELFIWNPDDLPCVDHQDRNKLNNTVDNLRWCSHSENIRNQSIRKDNTSGEMNISKCFSHGRPRWRVHFGNHKAGNEHVKLFPRDPDSDVIPDEVIAYKDQYSLKWKGQFHPK